MSLALNTKHLSSFINEEEYKAIYPQVEAAHKTLEAKNGPGSDFLGWMYLPRDYDKEEFERIKAAAARIREDSDVWWSPASAAAIWAHVPSSRPSRGCTTTSWTTAEDLLLRQQHQPHLSE